MIHPDYYKPTPSYLPDNKGGQPSKGCENFIKQDYYLWRISLWSNGIVIKLKSYL